jgi:hypothetical protein
MSKKNLNVVKAFKGRHKNGLASGQEKNIDFKSLKTA